MVSKKRISKLRGEKMLKGKNAIVTGASRGIGRAIAIELANQGANVCINYAGNETKANEVVEELKQKGVKAFSVKADVSDEKDVKNLMKETLDRKSTRLNSSHVAISYAVFCLKKK